MTVVVVYGSFDEMERDTDLGRAARALPFGYVLYHGVLGWRCCPRAELSHDEFTQWARPEDAITEMLQAKQGEAK